MLSLYCVCCCLAYPKYVLFLDGLRHVLGGQHMCGDTQEKPWLIPLCHPLLQEYQFRGIQKAEWNNLFSFIKAKRLKIENVDEVEMGPSGAARPGLDIDLGEDIDTGGDSFPVLPTRTEDNSHLNVQGCMNATVDWSPSCACTARVRTKAGLKAGLQPCCIFTVWLFESPSDVKLNLNTSCQVIPTRRLHVSKPGHLQVLP